ncbi:DUF2726 domain-containing protein [Dyadobacter sp. BHUBP1]|uniref:DUF2726 domain-containing protein n=1 Tax=Dyadobacter sp. BHUBP1 TaxID=3424178 RepID=UPI003D356C1C
MKYDRENTLLMLQQRDWNSLIDLFKDNRIYLEIEQDSIIQSILEREFISELIGGSGFDDDPEYLFYLEQFHILHVSPHYKFSLKAIHVDPLVEKIIGIYRADSLEKAVFYAKKYANLPVSIEILAEIENSQPKVIQHSLSSTIKVTENREIEPVDSTTSVFKSQHERRFYMAVRAIFHTYLVLPNVAISAVVDFESVKHHLDQKERAYFFTALIDCVVVDAQNEFRPIKMLEIDSLYHDDEEQLRKDRMKDKIIAKAGHKLLRIRATGSHSEEDLQKLILEVTR